jgi:sulfoxide reductase catalytic subunit YedY
MPRDRLWTSMDEEESYSSVVALPGRSNLGLGRHWHFFSVIFWIVNGAAYYALLFTTGVWQTLIPNSWSIFPDAINTMMIYARGQLPPPGNPFDPAQQLAYAVVVFILGPLLILTGIAMSPSVGARFPRYIKALGGRQVARSIHFVVMVLIVLFIIVHLVMVVWNRFTLNMANIINGGGTLPIADAVLFFVAYFVVVIAINAWATHSSLSYPRKVQRSLGAVVDPARHLLFNHAKSKQDLSPREISPYFRVNGRPPETEEYLEIAREHFEKYRLRVYGLVDNPREFSLEDLKSLKRRQQITEHVCIQGWTSIGEWGGVPLASLLSLCVPKKNARYVVFHSFGTGEKDEYGHGDPTKEFYEVLDLELANHLQTILAYEMNFQPLPIPHGAPLRLRCETQLGYKMVKWLKSIELVDDYSKVGEGLGGYREDVQHYGFGASI